jgi:hypothetical protein
MAATAPSSTRAIGFRCQWSRVKTSTAQVGGPNAGRRLIPKTMAKSARYRTPRPYGTFQPSEGCQETHRGCGCRKCHPRASRCQFVFVDETTELVGSS